MSEHDMHLLDSAPFGRILPAMVTPMKSDGSVDFAAAQKLAKYLVADGASGGQWHHRRIARHPYG